VLFSRVSRAYKYIHNYLHILNFVYRTTFVVVKIIGLPGSSAVNNFIRDGAVNDASVTDVVLSPTVTSVYFLTAENLYKVGYQQRSEQFCLGGTWPLRSHSGCATVTCKTDSLLFHSELF